MALKIRHYKTYHWKVLCQIHDQAPIEELKGFGDLDAFLTLEQTYQNEGLFDGEVWVCESGGVVFGFVAFAEK